jgi:hydroxymethylpyrimidine/phosphomethylpyrimidine kinase
MTIAGSDSGGGAGLQADLRTFAAHGVHGACAVTAVTAQNSVTVTDYVALDPRMVVAQVEAVVSDMPVAAVKTGMLANRGIVAAVADVVRRHALPHLVVDPVMVAKGGARLLDADAEKAYVEHLFALTEVLTPNLPEAEVLLGRPVRTREAMREAARALRAQGPRVVVVKGGHLPGGEAVDVFYDGERLEELAAPRIDTRHTHGTGCTYSAAVAARLALGEAPLAAVRGAKDYLTEALRGAYAVGHGHGPVDHLHPLTRAARRA